MNAAQDQQSRELLPCPFCGQQDAFVEQLDTDASVVICDARISEHCACLARGPVAVRDDEDEMQPGRTAAIAAWNRRAPAEQAARALPARGVDPMLDTPAGMEPGWFLHTLDITDGIPGNTLHERVTKEKAPPFGEPGRDYSAEYPATSTPLYTAAQVLAMGRVPPRCQAVPLEMSKAQLIRVASRWPFDTTYLPRLYADLLSVTTQPLTAGELAAALDQPLTDEQIAGWIPVGERLPEATAFCDWLMPTSDLKRERWILAGEAIVTASVPGSATHWRPAQALPG